MYPDGYPTPKATERPRETVLNDVLALDLTAIRQKVKLENYPYGHEADEYMLSQDELKYRHFLFLAGTSDTIVIPTEEIDAFWHHHILDTAKYEQDCMRIFGFFIHHFPYLGLRGDADKAKLRELYNQTETLYSLTFGEVYNPRDNDLSGCG